MAPLDTVSHASGPFRSLRGRRPPWCACSRNLLHIFKIHSCPLARRDATRLAGFAPCDRSSLCNAAVPIKTRYLLHPLARYGIDCASRGFFASPWTMRFANSFVCSDRTRCRKSRLESRNYSKRPEMAVQRMVYNLVWFPLILLTANARPVGSCRAWLPGSDGGGSQTTAFLTPFLRDNSEDRKPQ